MKIYLTGHNNFGNRGCEALVRSTVDLVRATISDAEFFVPTGDVVRDSAQWPEASTHGVRFVPVAAVPSRFIQWSRICSRIPFLASFRWPTLRNPSELSTEILTSDAILSIGGDNYSLDYDLASLAYFVAVAEAGLKRKIPVILWGASVGPFKARPAVEKKMREHLLRMSYLVIRESHSVRYLEELGVTHNVTSGTDSAFALTPEALDMSPFWPTTGAMGVLGLNISPLIETVRAKAGNRTALVDEVVQFVRASLHSRDLGVILIPHVAPLNGSERNNDERLLADIFDKLSDLGTRIALVPSGMNAAQLKFIIGQCRFFIGARTHATIAALSMKVPTLSIAYSVKALGINLDLFGHERYAIDTRTLNAHSLNAGFEMLCAEEVAIRTLLSERIPAWKERATLGASLLAAHGK